MCKPPSLKGGLHPLSSRYHNMKFKRNLLTTSISLILVSHVLPSFASTQNSDNLKATKTNVAFSDIEISEYSTKGKPNIIILTVDDMGYGQMNFDQNTFNEESMKDQKVVDTYKIPIDEAINAAKNSTPTINKLIGTGVKINNGYVAHGVSGPSRAAIITGKAPAKFGVYSNIDAEQGIPVEEKFLPEIFQNHGYYTAAVGKWHLSKISNVAVDEAKQTRDYHDNFITYSGEQWQPQNRGFNYFMGFHTHGVAYYNSPALFRNRENIPAKGYVIDQFTNEAIGVVNKAKSNDAPFLLYLAYNAPHLPNDAPAPKQYQQRFKTGSQTADNFYASIYAVDQGVKRLLAQLKANGQYDNTLIMFTSDNGAVIDGPLPLNGEQKGFKSQVLSGGLHTPMFVWWNGRFHKTTKEFNKLTSSMDFFPTALDAAGIKIPEGLDGVSLLPYLNGEKTNSSPHKSLVWIAPYAHHFDEKNIPFWNNYHKYVRSESDDYPINPYTEQFSDFSWAVRTDRFSLIYNPEDKKIGLYKLEDVRHENEISEQYPNVVSAMKNDLAEFANKSKMPISKDNYDKFNKVISEIN